MRIVLRIGMRIHTTSCRTVKQAFTGRTELSSVVRLNSLELFDCGFGKHAEETRGGIRGKEILRDEELLELPHILAACAAREVAGEVGADGGVENFAALQLLDLCLQRRELRLEVEERGGGHKEWRNQKYKKDG